MTIQLTHKWWRNVGVVSVAFVSAAAWIITYRHGLVTAYNDSMSHLDLARMVVDSQQPGIAQLGSVWLPLNQLLYLPLIWVGWAWHSGFAGSLVSMISYVVAIFGLYFTVLELTGKKFSAVVGALAAALNLNLLYLQATPLTESVFLAMLVLSLLFLVKYLKTHNTTFLIVAALCTALQVAGRYDGWFVAVVEALVVTYHEIFVRKLSIQKALGVLGLFAVPIIFTMALWFLWNTLLFGNPLYSFNGPYSAHAQQATLQAHGGLPTKFNLWQSVRFFALDARDNIGMVIAAFGLLGWVLYLAFQKGKLWPKLAVLFLFLSDGLFNVVALFFGFSVLNVPATHWNPSHDLAGEYFNVRYGITVLPFVAVGFGLLAAKTKKVAIVLPLLVILQAGMMLHAGLATVKDGTVGSSSFVDQDVAAVLKKDVGPHDQVIISTSYYNAVMFRSGLDFKHFIYEGISSKWKAAIARPADYAQWIVVANGNVGDPLYDSLVIKEKNAFLSSYKLVLAGHHANVYERKTPFEMYVAAKGNELVDGSHTFATKGVNSYDLAYQNRPTIDATFKALQSAGVNTIRFWMFGDGNPDGFQPNPGQLNEARLQTTDYIFAESDAYHIRLLPTLTNNWADYGGMDKYLAWVGLDNNSHDSFYADPQVISLYENYINHVLTRRNTITGQLYSQDSAVLAWDIANEPRVFDPGDVAWVASWTNTIARYVKSVDANHLVTISLDDAMLPNEQQICHSKFIDFCSVHVYPQNQQDFSSLSQEAQQLAAYKAVASALHKPIVLSEFGVSKNVNPFGQPPLAVLGDSLQAAERAQYSGWLVWNWSQRPDDSYGFSPDGTNGVFTLKQLQQLIKSP